MSYYTFLTDMPPVYRLQWILHFNGTNDVLQLEAASENIATFVNGVGTTVGSVTISTDGVTYGTISYPFTPVVGMYYFKRSDKAGSGNYKMNAL